MTLGELRVFVVGSAPVIEIWVKDSQRPPQPLVPDGYVKVAIFDPNGVAVVDPPQEATLVDAATGLFKFAWQSLVTSELGIYSVQLRTMHEGLVTIEPREAAFQLVFQ